MDGECDLKPRFPPPPTSSLLLPSLLSSSIVIDAPAPSPNVATWDATIEVNGVPNVTAQPLVYNGFRVLNRNMLQVLGKSNLLLQGTHLRNCPYIIGVVAYTGAATTPLNIR